MDQIMSSLSANSQNQLIDEIFSLRTQLTDAQSRAERAEAQKDETEQVCALIAHVIGLLERGEVNKALIHLGALLNTNTSDKESRDAAR